MIVVDTNILVYFWLPGDHTQQVEKLLMKDSHWVSSTLWRSEFRNVVGSFFRKGILSYNEAIEIILNAEEQMVNSEYMVNSVKVIDKVKESKCTAYDCEYVVLAEELETVLITKDKEILKYFPNIAKDLDEFVT